VNNNDMSKASFQVVYDGPALTSHEMEVKDLAPALLALGDIFEAANDTLNDNRCKATVSVQGSFKTGCFAIDIAVTQSLLQQAQELFTHDGITAAVNLSTLLGLSGASAGFSVFKLIKWIKGRKIDKVELLDSGNTKIFCSADSLEVEKDVLELYRNWKIRKAFERLVYDPLQRPGIDSFATRRDGEEFASVSKAEASFFVAPSQSEEALSDTEREASLQLVSISFRDDHKWKFFDGAASFHASILDEPFLRRVQLDEARFGKGDILKVRLREVKTLAGDNLKAEYQVLEVIDHRRKHTLTK